MPKRATKSDTRIYPIILKKTALVNYFFVKFLDFIRGVFYINSITFIWRGSQRNVKVHSVP